MGNFARFFMIIGAVAIFGVIGAWISNGNGTAVLIGGGIGGMIGSFMAGRTFGG